jgi:hypothetical protein
MNASTTSANHNETLVGDEVELNVINYRTTTQLWREKK